MCLMYMEIVFLMILKYFCFIEWFMILGIVVYLYFIRRIGGYGKRIVVSYLFLKLVGN